MLLEPVLGERRSAREDDKGGGATTGCECRSAVQVSEESSSANQSSLAALLSELNTSAVEAGSKVQVEDDGVATAARATEVTHRFAGRLPLMGVTVVRDGVDDRLFFIGVQND